MDPRSKIFGGHLDNGEMVPPGGSARFQGQGEYSFLAVRDSGGDVWQIPTHAGEREEYLIRLRTWWERHATFLN